MVNRDTVKQKCPGTVVYFHFRIGSPFCKCTKELMDSNKNERKEFRDCSNSTLASGGRGKEQDQLPKRLAALVCHFSSFPHFTFLLCTISPIHIHPPELGPTGGWGERSWKAKSRPILCLVGHRSQLISSAFRSSSSSSRS